MKLLRNSLFGMYLDFKVSFSMNPVLTTLLGASTVMFIYGILTIFGL